MSIENASNPLISEKSVPSVAQGDGKTVEPLTALMDDVLAWRLGEIARDAGNLGRVGDVIDRGLLLRRLLEENGFALYEITPSVSPGNAANKMEAEKPSWENGYDCTCESRTNNWTKPHEPGCPALGKPEPPKPEPPKAGGVRTQKELPQISKWYEALRSLYDYQNGCPLPSYARKWGEAMEECARLITIYERADSVEESSAVNPSLGNPKTERSKCCNWPVEIRSADEGTNHYSCTRCGQPCDSVAAAAEDVAGKWTREAVEGGWVYHFGNGVTFVPSRRKDDLKLFESIWDFHNSCVSRLQEKLQTEIGIVDKVWAALGITSYEQADGLTIWELVSRLQEQIKTGTALIREHEAAWIDTVDLFDGKGWTAAQQPRFVYEAVVALLARAEAAEEQIKIADWKLANEIVRCSGLEIRAEEAEEQIKKLEGAT